MALASPNILNYAIGKGAVYIKRTTETNFRPIGNCPEFEFTPEIEKLEHFSSQSGTRTRDRSIVIEKKASLRIVMEEITAENMALALLSTVSEDSGGDQEGGIFSESAIRCAIKFVGANEVGARYEWYFPEVDIIPSSGVNLISDEWMQMEITGDVQYQASAGNFGTWRKVADGA